MTSFNQPHVASDNAADGATVAQCAILVGGFGTRLGALTVDTPKPLLPCGDRPFLAWLMRELIRFGVRDFVLLTGHLSERFSEALSGILATLPLHVEVRISREPAPAGTGGAILHAAEMLDERFLLCNGDSVFDCNLSRLLATAAATPKQAGHVVLRHVHDTGRYGVVTLADDRITAFRARPVATDAGPGLINGGIYLMRRDALLQHLSVPCSLEEEVLPRLAEAGQLGGLVCEGYFIDIGVPEDFTRAQTELPQRLKRPALFLDGDGVLNHDHGYVGHRERFEWIDGALAAIAAATDAGWHVFVVTNLCGVAPGLFDEAKVIASLDWVADSARAHGGTIDDWRYCPYHPEAAAAAYRRTSDWRKPAPGMLLELLRCWRLDPAQSHMLGDQPSDLQAAVAAGVAASLFTGGQVDEIVLALLANRPKMDRP